MTRDQLLVVIREAVCFQMGIEDRSFTNEQTFSDLGCDSLDMVEILMEVESRIGIFIDDDAPLAMPGTTINAATDTTKELYDGKNR